MSTPLRGSSARFSGAPSNAFGACRAHLTVVAVTPVRSPGGGGAVVWVGPEPVGPRGGLVEPGAPGVPGAPGGPGAWPRAPALAAEPTPPAFEIAASGPLS